LSKEEIVMAVQREVHVDASPEEVWEALVTEEGRERWLQEPGRDIHIELQDAPHRLVWWWAAPEEPVTRVEFLVLATPCGTRVLVTESMPALPLASLAASFALVCA
jgi:uncharacterized protein YndB with AHSA1/START domain